MWSVIVVNFNGGYAASEAVASCVLEGVNQHRCIVVDNGSVDDSLLILLKRFPDVTILRNTCNSGFAHAVNQGLARVDGDQIIVLNNDARLLPGTLGAIEKCFDEYPRAVIVGARLLDGQNRPQNAVSALPCWWHEFAPRSLLKRLAPHYFCGRMEDVVDSRLVPSVIGAAMTVRRSFLPQLGMLDEDFFFYLEETEWCARAHRLGFDVVFCPDARVEHALGGTAKKFKVGSRIEFQRSRLLYARKVEGRIPWVVLSLWMPVKAAIDFLSNGTAMVLTLGLLPRQRKRCLTYGGILMWHLLFRPAHWGLPGKCGK